MNARTLAEPCPERLGTGPLRYLVAVRPPFLLATALPVLLGWALVIHAGQAVEPLTAAIVLVAALLLHAAVNVLNDYHDSRNGTDAANDERIFPFTGGSRIIQNDVLGERQMLWYGLMLLGASCALGMWLAASGAPGLYLLGLVGVLIGWGYSAPPFRLNSRGLGEFAVAAGFSLLPAGSAHALGVPLSAGLVMAGLSTGFLTAALLYVNQFPDARADAGAGKRHWVVRLGAARARWGYPLLVVLALVWLLWAVGRGALPPLALLGVLSLPLSVLAAWGVLRNAATPAALAPSIRLTLAAVSLHAVLVTLGTVLD
jgi:1,4-dihydroxy-2-naphthoate octaprenyltransferase